jgi:4-diphosphocytidyl-2-C-methyl-D-erythritol kinase
MKPSIADQKPEDALKDLSSAVRERARAKVNLTLHIRGKRADGYHELESLVVFAGLCDELAFRKARADGLTIEGPFATALEGENLILKAKHAVSSWLGTPIYGSFRLLKNIPVAAGLGGGSSDAAAAIRALLRAYRGSPDSSAFASQAAAIGADVPVCLHHGAAWMRGLGERVTAIDKCVPLPAILVNPRLKLSTAAVFKRLGAPAYHPESATDTAPPVAAWDDVPSVAAFCREGRNDLETAALALEPAIGTVVEALARLDGCLLARLSGSGPTCFGLFSSQEEAAVGAAMLGDRHPNWWVVPTLLS